MITYINPAVAVAIGVSVLREWLTPAMLGAFVLILGGSVLATRPGQHSRPSPGTEPAVAGLLPGTAGRAAVASGQAQVCPTSQASGPDLYAIGMKSTNDRVRSRPQRTYRACLLAMMAIAVAIAVYGRTPSTTHRRGRIQG